MAKKVDEDLNEIFAVKLTRDVSNFPSDGDLAYIRNKFDVADVVPVVVFDQSGKWVSTHSQVSWLNWIEQLTSNQQVAGSSPAEITNYIQCVMPIYSFRNNKTGEEWEESMSYDESVKFLEDNPHFEKFPGGAPALVGGTGDRTKTDDGFKEVLSKIADANPNSNLASDYGKKDKKSVTVRNAVQRVQKKLGGNISE